MQDKKIKTARINRIKQPPLKVTLKEVDTPEEVMEAVRNCCKIEKIDHPSHYKGHKFEAIDIIEDFNLNFNLGNALKYILRAGKKNEIEDQRDLDLKKASWYLTRELERKND